MCSSRCRDSPLLPPLRPYKSLSRGSRRLPEPEFRAPAASGSFFASSPAAASRTLAPRIPQSSKALQQRGWASPSRDESLAVRRGRQSEGLAIAILKTNRYNPPPQTISLKSLTFVGSESKWLLENVDAANPFAAFI